MTSQSASSTAHRSSDYSRQTSPTTGALLLHRGEYLYRMGDPLPGIYLVTAGVIKLYRVTESGDQQIIGFFMSGDVFGLDALADGISRSMAMALDTTSVSLIPFDSVLTGNEKFDTQELIRRMGMTLNRDNELIMMLSQRTADRRLAWFLAGLSDHFAKRGLSPLEFTLPMSRTEIARYLGLALETVCRELAHFHDMGLIDIDRRRLYILDLDGIRHLANNDESGET